MKEFTNNLTKYNFKMDTIKLFDSFAGIGALHQSLKELGVPIEVVGMSEIDVDAIISYAAIHIENFKNIKFEFLAEDDMRQWLIERNIGYSFEKQKSSIPRLKKDKLYNVYKASVLLNNLGDISTLDYNNMIDFDLFNFSFPCTDISGAGKQKGLKNADGTPTRSGLVKYGIEIIKAKKPKYIMIENVKALIQKKFIGDFYDIVSEIESYGYSCYYPKKDNGEPTCLNAKNYGIPQNRERIFVICVRKDIDNQNFEFPIGFDNGLRLKDCLEDEINEKYYLSQEIQDRFKLNGNKDIEHNELNVIGSSAPDFRTIGQRDMTYGINGVMSTLTATDYKQPKQIIDKQGMVNYNYNIKLRENGISNCIDTGIGRFPDNHGSRTGVIEFTDNELNQIGELDLEGYNDFSKRVYNINNLGRTLMASGGNLNDKAGQYLDKTYRIRRLTPKCCWRLMGFRDKCFDRAQAMGIADSGLYKQAGNSIVVNCLYYIFKNLFKEYIV